MRESGHLLAMPRQPGIPNAGFEGLVFFLLFYHIFFLMLTIDPACLNHL